MYREILLSELKVQKSSGYLYFIDKEHPLAIGKALYVYYHRHVASLKLGRWLTSNEHVHHLDENRVNNNPDNLDVMSASEHAKVHNVSLPDAVCLQCRAEFTPSRNTTKYCSVECVTKSKVKLDFLTKDELELLIWSKSLSSLAKELGCSDNGIKKWAVRLGCLMPPTRFHSKITNKDLKLAAYMAAKV